MSEQRALDFEQLARVEKAEAAREELTRVRKTLGPRIVAWASQRLASGAAEFRASELKAAVAGAPASPDRVLRDLRKRGVVGYEVVSKPKSLYRLTYVRPERLDAPRKTKRQRLEEKLAYHRERAAELLRALADEGEAA